MQLILPTPELLVRPGEPTTVDVIVWNDRDVHDQIRVRAVGVEDAWSAPPQDTPVLAPGDRHLVRFVVRLPEGFPAGGHSCAFEATSVSGGAATTNAPAPEVIRSEVTLRVGDLGDVSIQLEPRRVLDSGRFRVRIQNRSLQRVQLHLAGRTAGNKLRFRFRPPTVDIPPGGQTLVKSKVIGHRHVVGAPRKTAFTIVAQGQSEPVFLSGTWERRAALRSNVVKAMAVLTVIGIWAASVGIGVTWIRDRNKQDPVALADAALQDQLHPGDGAPGDDGSGPAGDPGAIDPSAPGAGRVVTSVGGIVEGTSGGGVNVQLRPVNPAALAGPTAATGAGLGALKGTGSLASGAKLTKQLGRSANVFLRIDQMQSATTTSDGVWSFGGVEGPGFYELRFGKRGFSTKSAIVEIDGEGTPVRLDLSLDAAFGRVVGTVVDPDGQPIPGAAIGVTDGLIQADTRADGSGAFSVDGLTQDGQYTVSAAADGYGTGFARVRLDGEQSEPVVIELVPGTGTIFGTVLSTRDDVLAANNGSLELADATVTVSDGGNVTRTISTLDDGFFQIAGLPLGGPYTVRIEADQHLTQVQTVMLSSGELELNVTLMGANGRVQGDVVATSDHAPLNGVGVTLTSDAAKFKTLTDANGAFDVVDVPPGDYTAAFGLFGYADQLVNLTVAPGSVTTVDTVTMAADTREPFPSTGSMEITAFLVDEPDTKLEGLSVFVNDQLKGLTDPDGFLRIADLPVGTSYIRISDLRAQPTVADFTRPVNLGEAGTVDVQAGMRRLASLKGMVSGPTVASIGGAVDVTPLADIAVCILPPSAADGYVDPTKGSCLDDPDLVASRTTLIDGSYKFDVVRSGTFKVVYQSVQDVPTPVGGVDKVAYLYRPTIKEYTFNAGASLENEDVVLDLYPILSIRVTRPDPGAGASGSDDLANFVGVGAGDATLEFYDSSGTDRMVLLDPVNATPQSFAIASRLDVGSNGTVEVQILSAGPAITVDAVSNVPEIGRPITTPLSGAVNGTELELTTAVDTRRNVALPLVTNRQFVGSFQYDYARFPVSGGFTSDDPTAAADTVGLSPGVIDVTVTGVFDVLGSSTLAPTLAGPDVQAATSVTKPTDANGSFVFSVSDPDQVPAGATVDVTAGGSGTGFQQRTIVDQPIPQLGTLDNTELVPAAGHDVTGIVRDLCYQCNVGTVVGVYNERPDGAGRTVTLVPADDPSNPLTTTTDVNGAFTFPAVALGQYRIVVEDQSRIWYPSTLGSTTLKPGSRTTARILADVTRSGVVYRLDDDVAANTAYPAAITTTNTDPAGTRVVGGGAYIGFVDMAEVTADLANVNGIDTRVELWRTTLVDPAVVTDPCPAVADYAALGYTSEGVQDVTADGPVTFGGLERLDYQEVRDPIFNILVSTTRQYFCARATRAVDNGETVAVAALLRDGRAANVDITRPLSATVDVTLAPAVQFAGSLESSRGSYAPTASSGPVQITDILAGGTVQVFDTATATTCGTTFRNAQATSGTDGSFTTNAVLGAADHCLRISAVGHDGKDLPQGNAGENPTGGIDDVGTVTLAAKKPNLTVNLVDTFGDPVDVGSGTVTMRFTPGGSYQPADTAFDPDVTGTTSVTFNSVVPTLYELVIAIPGYASVTKTVNVLPTDSADVTLATTSVLVSGLQPDENVALEGLGQSVVGTVKVRYGTGATAKDVAIPTGVSFSVSVSRKNSDLSNLITADQDGDTFSGSLKPGKNYTFSASATGFTSVPVTNVTVASSGVTTVDLVMTPNTRNVTIPLNGITGATDELIGTVVGLEALTDAATTRPGTPYVGTATVARAEPNTARATLTNVVPGTYRVTVDVPTRLPGYRDTLTAADAGAFPPSSGSFTIDVGWVDNSATLTAGTITLAVYKQLDLVSGDAGTAITVADASATAGDLTLSPLPRNPGAADTTAEPAYYAFTVTGADPTQSSITFDAAGHDPATITITADGATAATQTVCLTKSAIPGNDGPDGQPGTADDVAPVPADDCSDVSGALVG